MSKYKEMLPDEDVTPEDALEAEITSIHGELCSIRSFRDLGIIEDCVDNLKTLKDDLY